MSSRLVMVPIAPGGTQLSNQDSSFISSCVPFPYIYTHFCESFLKICLSPAFFPKSNGSCCSRQPVTFSHLEFLRKCLTDTPPCTALFLLSFTPSVTILKYNHINSMLEISRCPYRLKVIIQFPSHAVENHF